MYRGEAITLTGRKLSRFGEATGFDEGLYDLGDGVYTWMVPNGSWGESNSGLVVGDGESMLLDTQSEARELKPASMTLMSGVTGAIARLSRGKPRKACRYLHGMTSPFDYRGARAALANITFEKNTTIQVGGREVRLIEAGPAHTRGDIVAYVPDARLVFCGDIAFVGSTPVIWAGPLENWLASLEKILDLDAETFVPGHGPVCGGDGLLQTKEYLKYIGREIGRCHKAGMSARGAACDIALGPDFAGSEYAAWDSPERIMTSAHVTYRHLQGKGGHLKPAERLSILWKQGLLASAMPDAVPASMHRL